MTNLQLYLAIGVPVVLNFALTVTMFTLLSQRMTDRFDAVNQRMTDGFAAINHRFDAIDTRFTDLRNGWHDALLRVEGVLDARLKQLEERGRP